MIDETLYLSILLEGLSTGHEPNSPSSPNAQPVQMHDCLRVQDIVELIFTQVYQNSPGQTGKQDLLSLALTCHDFQETALDILWHTQTNLVQLIKTLPRRCWNETPDSGFDRKFKLNDEAISGDDLARLAFYTRRIRRVRYLPYAWHAEALSEQMRGRHIRASRSDMVPLRFDLIALRSLWTKRADKTKPLFPNLLRVEFVDIRHASPCLDIFLETKFISLSLYWSESNGDVTTLFKTIGQHALNMQELDLGTFQASKPTNDNHLSDLVSRMTDLRGLCCASHKLNTPAINHLSLLPHLRTLQIPNTSSDIFRCVQRTLLTHFPELQRLVMSVGDFSTFTDLVKVLRRLELQDLTLHCSKFPSATEFHNSFTALEQASSQCGHFLRIVVKYTSQDRRLSADAPISEHVLISGPILQPLLSFRNLAVLELDIPCKIELGDTQLMAMADAWPRLRRLQLGAFVGWHLPLLITFNGFMHLLGKCPELEFLAFAFNASSEIPISPQIPAASINKNITYIYVGESRVPPNSAKHVGGFLAHVLPNLCGIGGDWMYKGGLEIDQRLWAEAVEALKKAR